MKALVFELGGKIKSDSSSVAKLRVVWKGEKSESCTFEGCMEKGWDK